MDVQVRAANGRSAVAANEVGIELDTGAYPGRNGLESFRSYGSDSSHLVFDGSIDGDPPTWR